MGVGLVQTFCVGLYCVCERRSPRHVILTMDVTHTLTFIRLCLSIGVHRLLSATACKHTGFLRFGL